MLTVSEAKRMSQMGLDWFSHRFFHKEEMSVHVFERGGTALTSQKVMDLENINEFAYMHVYGCSQRPKEAILSPGVGVAVLIHLILGSGSET